MANAKRISALVLAIVMIVAMFAGCNSGSNNASTTAAAATTTKAAATTAAAAATTAAAPAGDAAEETLAIEVLFSDHDSQPYSADTWLLPKVALEKFNIQMNMNAIPSASWVDKRNTTLASGDLPDIIMGVDKSVIDEYGPMGMFLNFMDYADVMPNMLAAMDKFADIGANMQSATEMYGMPGSITTAGNVATAAYFIPMIRADLVADLGISSDWKTYDEFYNVLKALKDANPESYPWVNRQKVDFLLSVFAPGLGIDCFPSGICGTGFAVWNGTSFTSILDEANFKEWVIFMNKLFADGLLDPSYATDDTQTWESKIVSGAGSFACDYFARPEMMSSIGITSNPNYSLEAVLVPMMDGGSQTIFSRLGIGGWNIVDAKTEDPARLCEFIDYWRYTEEGSFLMNYGLEGEHYVINDDNTISQIFMEGVTNKLDQDAKLGINYLTFWSFKPDFYGYDMYDANATYHTNQVWELLADKQIPSPPSLVRNAEETAALAEYSADLLDVQRNTINEMIMGIRSVDEWDAIVEEWMDAEYQTYLDEANATYARIYG